MTSFTAAPVKPAVAFSVFESIDIRVGTITAVNDVPNSRKLVAFTVDFGDHARQILVGMKQERPDVAALVGRQTLFVINFEPKKIAGMISEGMLVDVGYADGLPPALALLERPLPNGTRAG